MSKIKPKVRRAERIHRRRVVQNDLALRGWVPMRNLAGHGVYHPDTGRCVRREFDGISMRWGYVTVILLRDVHVTELTWNELQAAWVRRIVTLMRRVGWL